jgi:Fic family protein
MTNQDTLRGAAHGLAHVLRQAIRDKAIDSPHLDSVEFWLDLVKIQLAKLDAEGRVTTPNPYDDGTAGL